MAFTTAPPSDKKQNTIHRYQVSDTVHCDLHYALCTVPSPNSPSTSITLHSTMFSGFNFVIIYKIVTISNNRHVSSISVYFNSILDAFLKVYGTLGANVKLIAAPLY